MSRTRWRTAAAAAALTAGALAPAAAAQAAETVYGVTASGQLVSFSSDSPGSVSAPRAIAGLQAGETVAGLDVRPSTGDLTALGSTGRLYLLEPRTGQASPLEGAPQLALDGTRFGVDFNPVADALRVVSDTGQNLRITQGGAGAVVTDAALNPAGAAVVAAAYTNAFHGTAATTLLDVDAASDTLRTQAPPNDGTLADVGALGVDVSADAAFDIAPAGGPGLLAARLEGQAATTLLSVNLATGAATTVGTVAGEPLTAIAVARQDPPLYALTAGGALLTLRSTAPFDKTQPLDVLGAAAVTGLQPGEELLGIDVRPATGELLGLGDTGRVYVLDARTGRAVSRTGTPLTLAGSHFGVDFNPVPDALRIVSDAEQNLRVPAGGTGAPVIDGPLNPGDPAVTGAAYLNPFAGTTATTLYDVDAGTSRLLRQDPPNNGTLADVGPLGVTLASPELGFDIAPQDNAGLLAADAGLGPDLHRVDLATGAAARVANLAISGGVRGLTVAGAGVIGLAATAYAAEEGQAVQIAVSRDGGAGTATVNWAVAGVASGALTFAPGETLKTFSVPNPQDTAAEAPTALAVTLGRAAGGYRLGTAAATLTITDDDAAAPADRTRPAVLLKANGLKLRALRRSGLRLAYSCSEACAVRVRLQLGRRVVGSARSRLAGPGVRSVRVRLSRSGARRVGTKRTRSLRVRVTATDPAGNTTRRTLRIRAKR